MSTIAVMTDPTTAPDDTLTARLAAAGYPSHHWRDVRRRTTVTHLITHLPSAAATADHVLPVLPQLAPSATWLHLALARADDAAVCAIAAADAGIRFVHAPCPPPSGGHVPWCLAHLDPGDPAAPLLRAAVPASHIVWAGRTLAPSRPRPDVRSGQVR